MDFPNERGADCAEPFDTVASAVEEAILGWIVKFWRRPGIGGGTIRGRVVRGWAAAPCLTIGGGTTRGITAFGWVDNAIGRVGGGGPTMGGPGVQGWIALRCTRDGGGAMRGMAWTNDACRRTDDGSRACAIGGMGHKSGVGLL